jgi:hypothetical protein
MSDLFDYGLKSPEPWEEPRTTLKIFRGSTRGTIVKTRNPGDRESQAKKPGDPRAPVNGSGFTRAPVPGDKIAGLLEQRSHLENEIEIAVVELAQANAQQQPYSAVFYAADNALRSLHDRREQGCLISKQQMLAAYDRRVAAGHAWNPSKQKFERVQRWLRDLRKELKWVNKEIGT